MRIVISSGHGSKVQGAVGPSPWGLHEHEEAVRVVNQTAIELRHLGVDVTTYEDTVSTNQDDNLDRIVSFHNAQSPHDLDVSIHFNSATFNGSNQTSNPVGCEVFYESSAGHEVAERVVEAICTNSGLKNRGAKDGNLYFLSNTAEVANLIEVCFVNSQADVEIYHNKFGEICQAIASGLVGHSIERPPWPEPGPEPEPPTTLFHALGRCSSFGGPADIGVAPSEGLAFISDIDQAPQLFLPAQPSGTTGLARRLNPFVHYVACRWDYAVTPKELLREKIATVYSPSTGITLKAFPADWGPNENTGRVADLSPSLLDDLGLTTDDTVEVMFPYDENIV